MNAPRPQVRSGFSLVEVMAAMVILTVGILGMAATTGFVFNQLKQSGQDTERSYAVQQVMEQVRSMPFTNLDVIQAATDSVGRYEVTWRVIGTPQTFARRVRIISQGPGFVSGQRWEMSVADSTEILVVRP